MKRFKKRYGKLGKRIALLVLSASVLITSLVLVGIYAKYVYNRDTLSLVEADAFYFESDLLKQGGASYILNAGTKEISFTVTNKADALRFSEMDISYTVSVVSGECSFSDVETVKEVSGTLAKGKDSTVTFRLYGLVDGGTYTVKAYGTGGFEKELTATFTVTEDPQKIYMHTQIMDDTAVLLTVWTKNLAGDVTIDVPEGLIPDNTYPQMGALKTGDDITVELSYYSSVSYRFFVGDWDKTTAFEVTLDNDGAEPVTAEPTEYFN